MLTKSYCFCSIEKAKTKFQLKNKFEHNLRLKNVENADPDRRAENEVLIGPDNTIDVFVVDRDEAVKKYKNKDYRTFQDECEDAKKMVEDASGRKVRKDAVLATEIVMTYTSTEDVDLERWKEKNVDWLKREFGEENVVSAVLHMDEASPHIHALVLPIDRDKEIPSFNAKKWTGGAKKLAMMQDRYAREMEEFGLERGERNSSASHMDIKRFHTALNNVVSAKAPERTPEMTDIDYQQVIDKAFQDHLLRIFALEKSIERLESVEKTRAKNESLYRRIAEARISGYESEIKVLKSDLSEAEKKARFVENVQLSISKTEENDPKKGKRLRDMLNQRAKEGSELRKALDKLDEIDGDR